jgi:lipooligosaccharide transport system permease protein
MMFLSGVFFPLDNLPDAVRWIAMALPLTQAVALVRPLFMDQWPSHALLHLGILSAYASVAWVIALHLTRKRFKQ